MVTRNSIMILNELSQRHMVPIKYQISNIGDVYTPVFRCVASYGTLRGSGEANNKKTAKELCANELLQIVRNAGVTVQNNDLSTSFKLLHMGSPKTEAIASSESTFHNYVGELNEHCSKNGLSYPNYAENDFSKAVSCTLMGNVTDGESLTKKQSKQEAAKKMLAIVKSKSSVHQFPTYDVKKPHPEVDNVPSDKDVLQVFCKIVLEDKLKNTDVAAEGKHLSDEYLVLKIQTSPVVILALKNKSTNKVITMAHGDTYEDAYSSLMELQSLFYEL